MVSTLTKATANQKALTLGGSSHSPHSELTCTRGAVTELGVRVGAQVVAVAPAVLRQGPGAGAVPGLDPSPARLVTLGPVRPRGVVSVDWARMKDSTQLESINDENYSPGPALIKER